ncbi:MAG: CDP-alcohol phosphatidyltransferase family protein [Proteobacteria bacterium]|nr:CDP-alcohol phosphatidyltransferase family protein [Pseudomonadota bacterium]
MLDSLIRPHIDVPLDKIAAYVAPSGISANRMTAIGALCGLAACLMLARADYIPALFFMALNRLADGLDGALARRDGSGTDAGGFLDIVSDFIFYAGFVFFFALGQPENALAAAFLIFTFMATGSAFLAYAIMAARRSINHDKNGKKSFFHLQGLAEGTETVIAFVLICLMPDHFTAIAVIFGLMCLVTAAGRIRKGMKDFG